MASVCKPLKNVWIYLLFTERKSICSSSDSSDDDEHDETSESSRSSRSFYIWCFGKMNPETGYTGSPGAMC